MRFYCFEVDYGGNDEYICCWREDEDARFYNNVHIDPYNSATFQLKTLRSKRVLGLDFCHMADVRVFLALVRPLMQVSC